MFHETEDSRVTRQLGSMEENYADSYANSYVRPPVPRLRSAPIPEVAYDDHPYDREIPSTLFLKLLEARVIRCVEHYARDNVAHAGDRDDIPIREGTIVTCIKALSRGYTECAEGVKFLWHNQNCPYGSRGYDVGETVSAPLGKCLRQGGWGAYAS